jgi:membrane-associated phospholipid phosphatase
MLDQLLQLDAALFRFINHQISNGFFDALMPFLRERWFWAPLYTFFVLFALFNFDFYRKWAFVLGIVAVFGFADFTSSTLIKKNVQRIRPCNDPAMQVELRTACGSGFSFTSSHATNHFAIAAYLIAFFAPLFRRLKPLLLLWAASVAFAQVYVGVHYPLDVICGGLLGWAIASAVLALPPLKRATIPRIPSQ